MQRIVVAASDERIKAVSDVVHNILFLKYYTLEPFFAQRIMQPRSKQLKSLWHVHLNDLGNRLVGVLVSACISSGYSLIF